jgi:NADPH:quinone reductase-like Zn-dependent oxidoreductase
MKAIKISQYGDENVLEIVDKDIPRPNDNQVLVKVHAAGVNPIDWKIRDGAGKRLGMTLPIYPGSEISGVVEQVGSQINDLRIGDEVFGTVKSGGYAEYALAQSGEMVKKPVGTDFTDAAGISLAALTAWQGLFDIANLVTGQRIFINAAAGSVGSYAVQLAKNKGAYVIGMAAGENEDYVRKLGIDGFIDYKKSSFEDIVKDMDVVFDLIGGEFADRSYQCVKKGGMLVTSVAFLSEDKAEQSGIRTSRVFCVPDDEELNQISRLIEEGKLTHQIAQVFPLEEVKRAHKLSKEGPLRGKIILKVKA